MADKKEKLRRVEASADALADVCVQVVVEQQASSSWWRQASAVAIDEEVLQRELAAAIRQKLHDIVEDAALTQTEKEQKEVQELVAQIESPTKPRVFTI